MATDFTGNDPSKNQDVRQYTKDQLDAALRTARFEAREAAKWQSKLRPAKVPMEKKDPDLWRALSEAQPTWQKDGLGVKGNNIQLHKEQPRVSWPVAVITALKQAANTETPDPPSLPLTDGGGGNTVEFSFLLEDASEENEPKVLIHDGEVNGETPDGMGTDEYVVDVYDGAFINLLVTYDTATLAITSLTFAVEADVADPTYGEFRIEIGRTYVDFDEDGNMTSFTAVNTQCGDINFALIYGAFNGQPAVIPLAAYSDWVPVS